MAKKNADPVEPIVPEEKKLDYDELHETPLEAIVAEEPEEEKKEEQPKEEEKKEEQKTPEPPKTEEEEIPFDPEEYKKQVKAEALAEAAKAIDLATKKEGKGEDTELIAPWTKENRAPASYDEVADWALAKKDILDKRAQEVSAKQQEEQKQNQEKANQAQIDQFNKFTDDQLSDLYAAGKLPRIVDQNNTSDPGVVARKDLFQTMLDINIDRQKQGKPPVYSVKEIFYEHYKAPEANTQPAGADAPIMGKSSSPAPESQEIDYVKDIQPGRNMTSWLTDVLRKK